MFIKKIILDGFKSYGRRVELTGFDEQFNAITGFNGSGKSNILDAIVFVLGLSKMEMARCTTLIELIYKNGCAGVSSASVTLELDNSDNKFALTEYRNSQTIIVRRMINLNNQSKYYIEGFLVTREKMLEFFHTVSLNIQNPHFLIMQGKIVKVSAAKPKEILAMVEEAVGVTIYENKKKQCQAKIERCNKMRANINMLISTSIEPKVAQLIHGQAKLNEYREKMAKCEVNQKVLLAYRYLKASAFINNADGAIEQLEQQRREKVTENTILQENMQQIRCEIERHQSQLNEEGGRHLKDLEENLNEKQSILERICAHRRIQMETITEEKTKMEALKKTIETEDKSVNLQRCDYESAANALKILRQENSEIVTNLHQAERAFAISLGLSRGRDGEEVATLAQQLMMAQEKLCAAQASENKCTLLIQQNGKTIAEKRQHILKEGYSHEKAQRDIEIETDEVVHFERELQVVSFDEERFNQLKSELANLLEEGQSLADMRNALQCEVPLAKFNYSMPYANFNCKDDIIGVCCDLFTLKSPEYALAIEKVVGGKLWNIVVKDENVAVALIQRGNIRERRTFLPLNRIQGRPTGGSTVLGVAEENVGKGNVFFAIDLVNYDPRLEMAMRYLFQDTLVCPDIDMAKKVAFARGVMKRTVTFEGEIFDPSGTLTGGSFNRGRQQLNCIAELRRLKEEMEALRRREANHQAEFDQLNSRAREFGEKKKKYQLKLRHIELLKQRMIESNHHILQGEIEAIQVSIEETKANMARWKEKKNELTQQITELKSKMDDSSEESRQKMESDDRLKKARKLFEFTAKKLEKEQQSLEQLSLEIKHREEGIVDLEERLAKVETDIATANREVDCLEMQMATVQREIEQVKVQHAECKGRLMEKSNVIKETFTQEGELQKKLEENSAQIQSIGYEIENVTDQIDRSRVTVRRLLSKYAWIAQEEDRFGDPESEFAVLLGDNFDEGTFACELHQLQLDVSSLSKSVNLRAAVMHSEQVNELEKLKRQRAIIEVDATKLANYMANVEKEKGTALRAAWHTIDDSFSSIFHTLVDGAHCKLVPIQRNDLTSGLEIKVQFGSVWKESLAELSGGQRSLVALSLILALLKYKPAPLYILDEVDAALDQSHTQNVGLMIRRHFKDSQFLIVSLKDDLYNSAKVLFQTQFLDGFSSVTRRCLN